MMPTTMRYLAWILFFHPGLRVIILSLMSVWLRLLSNEVCFFDNKKTTLPSRNNLVLKSGLLGSSYLSFIRIYQPQYSQ